MPNKLYNLQNMTGWNFTHMGTEQMDCVWYWSDNISRFCFDQCINAFDVEMHNVVAGFFMLIIVIFALNLFVAYKVEGKDHYKLTLLISCFFAAAYMAYVLFIFLKY